MKLRTLGPNQTELHTDEAVIFFSYQTPVAAVLQKTPYATPERNHWVVRTASKYSRTTSKHINRWLDGVESVEVPQEFLDGLVGK